MTAPSIALIVNTLRGGHTGHRAAIWMRTRNVNLGEIPAVLCESVEGRALVYAEVSACSFRGGESLLAEPVAQRQSGAAGSVGECLVLVVAGAEPFDVAPRVVERGSSHLCHDDRIAATESIDNGKIWGHDKSMTQTENQTTTVEYALMIDWEDGQPAEYVPAKSAGHAEHMAATIYRGRSCWTVGREAQPWRYVRRPDAVLTEVVAS